MDPLCLVEGRVRYPDGRPAPRASVWLTVRPAGAPRNVMADIGGHFLFDDVNPGEYILQAGAAPGDPRPEGEIWAATYFPSTVDRAAAEPIRVVTGLVATHDIRLRSVPARRIRGIVRDEKAGPANGVTVTLIPNAAGARPSAQTAADGAFDFLALDGQWRLSATRKDGDVERKGFADATVAGHDVENLEIRLALPFSIPVLIDRDQAPPVGRRVFPTMVYLSRADAPSLIRPVDGVFPNVYPGRYVIYAMMAEPGVYVDSIKFGETNVHGQAVEIWDASLPIRIMYKHGAAMIRGTVETGEGATVAVVNSDDDFAAEAFRTFPVARDGRFEVGNLRPGDYYVLALERNDPVIATPGFRRGLLPRAAKIHLEQGATVILNLKVAPTPR
jgi:hypothetical protein